LKLHDGGLPVFLWCQGGPYSKERDIDIKKAIDVAGNIE